MKLEDLIKRCEKCEEHECINCEISWNQVQEIKKLIQKEENLIKYLEDEITRIKDYCRKYG